MTKILILRIALQSETNGAFECAHFYCEYDVPLVNNVHMLVFTSRELKLKKAAPVSDLHLVSVQQTSDNGTEWLLIYMCVSCTNYFMSIEIL